MHNSHVRFTGRSRRVLFSAVLLGIILLGVMVAIDFQSGRTHTVPPSTYSMREWIDLDNQVVREALGNDNTDINVIANGYYPLGNWDGLLRLRVDDVAIYDAPRDAGLEERDIQLPSYLSEWEREGYSLCLLTYTVENIDARPVGNSTKSGRSGFSNSFLSTLKGIESYDQIYFDGMLEDGSLSEGDGNIFQLSPGETKTFHVGIVVVGESAPYALQLGDPNCNMEVLLECEDKRGHR